MCRRDGLGIFCGSIFGALIGFGGGVYGSVELGKTLVNKFSLSYQWAAVTLSFFASLAITALSIPIGHLVGSFFGGLCCCREDYIDENPSLLNT